MQPHHHDFGNKRFRFRSNTKKKRYCNEIYLNLMNKSLIYNLYKSVRDKMTRSLFKLRYIIYIDTVIYNNTPSTFRFKN